MVKIQLLERVFNFKIFKGKLFYNSYLSSKVYLLDGRLEHPDIIDLGVKVKGYYCFDAKIIAVDDNNHGYRFKSGLFEKIEDRTLDSLSSNLELGISTKWISYYPVDIEHSVFQVDTLRIQWTSKNPSLRFEGDLVISEFDKGFNLYEQESGRVLWSYALPDSKYDWYNLGSVYISERSVPIKAEIKKILGTFNEILWISLNSGRLLGLDIHTGDLRHDLAIPANFFAYISGYVNQFDSAADSLLDEKRGIIFGLHLTYYWEINLINPENEYILYDISEQCNKKLIGGNEIAADLVWRNEEIFFYQWSFAQDPSYVGIFNRNTRQITWTSRELGEEGIFKGVNKVEFSENRLYVLDRANTLHIFER